jgi:hypothetical protein
MNADIPAALARRLMASMLATTLPPAMAADQGA